MNRKQHTAGLRRLIAERRGLAALEFAIVVPVLIVLLFGVFEISQAFRARLKLAHATAILANMIAAESTVTSASLSGMCNVAAQAVQPFDDTNFSAAAGSKSTAINGVTPASWTDSRMCGTASNSLPAPPSTMMTQAGSSVISVRASYVYKPTLIMFIPAQTFVQDIQTTPRSNQTITCGCG